MNKNVDMNEVSKHENIQDWWDLNGTMKGLHAMNGLRISMICDALKNSGKITGPKYLSGINIIDVGCGAGILTEPLTKLGANVVGIDPSLELVNIAKQHAAINICSLGTIPTYLASSVEEHALSNCNKYDVLVTSEVVEHVQDKEKFLEACVKTLKPGGSLFLTTPSRTYISWLCNIIIAENVLKLLPKGTHEYGMFVSAKQVQQMLYKYSCKTVLINGIFYNILNNRWYWFPFTTLHYALHAIKMRSTF